MSSSRRGSASTERSRSSPNREGPEDTGATSSANGADSRTPPPVPVSAPSWPLEPDDVESAERAHEHVPEPRWSGKPHASGDGRGLIKAVLGLQVIVLAGLVALAVAVVEGRQLLTENRAELERIEELATETRRVASQHEDLKNEVMQLRSYVASQSREDVIFLKIMIAKPRIDPELARTIAKHVRHYSGVYGQDPDLVLAIIDIESDFDPNIVSHMGAVGLMQVMPQWKRVLGIDEDLEDIETSIKYGLQILGFYREMYKDLDVALTAYNRGPGAVDAALMRGADPKNNYAPTVLERYAYFRALNNPPS